MPGLAGLASQLNDMSAVSFSAIGRAICAMIVPLVVSDSDLAGTGGTMAAAIATTVIEIPMEFGLAMLNR